MRVVLSLVLASVLFGCASSMTPLPSAIYGRVKAPMNATSNSSTSYTGRACATSVLGIVATGDASIKAAALNGGITNIAFVDCESSHVPGFYARFCTIVSGS